MVWWPYLLLGVSLVALAYGGVTTWVLMARRSRAAAKRRRNPKLEVSQVAPRASDDESEAELPAPESSEADREARFRALRAIGRAAAGPAVPDDDPDNERRASHPPPRKRWPATPAAPPTAYTAAQRRKLRKPTETAEGMQAQAFLGSPATTPASRFVPPAKGFTATWVLRERPTVAARIGLAANVAGIVGTIVAIVALVLAR